METVVEKQKTAPQGLEALIRDMIRQHGSPLMIIQRSALEKQFNAFKRNLPSVDPFFAIKSNPNPEIIKYFVKLGAGFDVASATEIEWVLKAGAKPERIIFANTIKQTIITVALTVANASLCLANVNSILSLIISR